MRWMVTAAVIGLAAGILGVAAVAQTNTRVTRQISVDADFGDGWVGFDGLPGKYYFKLRVIAVEGQLELCGAGVFTDIYSRANETQALRETKLTMNGRAILEDLTYFARVNRRRDLDGATANCARTSAAVPRQEVEFDIEVPRKRYRF